MFWVFSSPCTTCRKTYFTANRHGSQKKKLSMPLTFMNKTDWLPGELRDINLRVWEGAQGKSDHTLMRTKLNQCHRCLSCQQYPRFIFEEEYSLHQTSTNRYISICSSRILEWDQNTLFTKILIWNYLCDCWRTWKIESFWWYCCWNWDCERTSSTIWTVRIYETAWLVIGKSIDISWSSTNKTMDSRS